MTLDIKSFTDIMAEYVDLDGKEVSEDSRFIEDLGFNSYDFMSLLGELEDKYDVEVDEREVTKIRTVGEAMEYINSLGE